MHVLFCLQLSDHFHLLLCSLLYGKHEPMNNDAFARFIKRPLHAETPAIMTVFAC
jgi:hypothetical protein